MVVVSLGLLSTGMMMMMVVTVALAELAHAYRAMGADALEDLLGPRLVAGDDVLASTRGKAADEGD